MKKTYIVIASAIMILFCLMYSVSYAYFSVNVTNDFNGGNKGSTNIDSDTVKDIIISDGNKITSSNIIPGESVTSTFTVQNPNSVSICFGLTWTDIVNEFSNKSDLVVSLKDKNGEVLVDEVAFPSDAGTSFIEGLNVDANATETYTLTVTYKNTNENQTVDINKKFQASLIGSLTKCKAKASDTIASLVGSADASSTEVYTVPGKTSNSCTYTLAYDGTDDNNLRYVGGNPCNYVTFNGEEAGWRIIGVLNTPEGQRVKLIRANSIGNLVRDYTSDENYSNNWETSSLQALLNSGAYYNRTTGQYYNGSSTATTLDFTSNGLTEEARQQIDTITWNLGGPTYMINNDKVRNWYKKERSASVYGSNPTEWIGKVGLMYASDYGYATSGGSSNDRTSCLENVFAYWNSTTITDCKFNDWLYSTTYYQWTLTSSSSSANQGFGINMGGGIDYGHMNLQRGVSPVVYLTSSVLIVDGEGTPENPYQIG